MAGRDYGIHWFRRDLRVAGNPALQWNYQKNEGRVVGLFCFDRAFLSRSDFSVTRFRFFLNTLAELAEELRSLGSDFLCLDTGPQDAFSDLVSRLEKSPAGLPNAWSWNRDYEPFARKRDSAVEALLNERGIATHTARDHLLLEPHEVTQKTNPNQGYQVFTPFSRRWLDRFHSEAVQRRVRSQESGIEYLKKDARKLHGLFQLSWTDLLSNSGQMNVLKAYQGEYEKEATIKLPAAGSRAAFHALKEFAERIDGYEVRRDVPSVRGTSGLSVYLKNGSLTIAQIIFALGLFRSNPDKSQHKFLLELIWREFYYHILFRHPHVETGAFQEKYNTLEWRNNEEQFEAWCKGRTGFPIVDAGMRQLNTTGWMHNRVRMIVASFLTKDLQIDWRRGERYFMEKLIDGDLAPNNGGWQWAASTGCDAQPYFRIFNPWTQSRRFDGEGQYIRKYVPELSEVETKSLHREDGARGSSYPAPIVDHALERKRALAMYKSVV